MDQIYLEVCKDSIKEGSRQLEEFLETVTDSSMQLRQLFAVLIRKGVITQEEFDEGWECQLTWGKPTRYAASELERMGKKCPGDATAA